MKRCRGSMGFDRGRLRRTNHLFVLLHAHLTDASEPSSIAPFPRDQVRFLPERMARSHKSLMTVKMREVRVMTETGKELQFMTNDLGSSADKIGVLPRTPLASRIVLPLGQTEFQDQTVP